MEDNPQTTLKELSAEIQQFLNIRQDAALPERSVSSHINAVDSQSRKRDPPSPCFRCGALHWSKDCPFLSKTCHDCGNSGHKRGFCKNFKTKKKQKPKRKRRTANNVVIASIHVDAASTSRIYRPVQINGKTIRMRLDTSADVTLLSHADWIAIGRPTLQSPQITLRSANNKPIKVRGRYECNFVIDGQHGRGTCYVADTPSLLGLDWITQHEPLFRRLTEGSICNVSSSTLNKLNSSLTAHLKKKFATVFTPGLGHCTKSKAKLVLKPDAKPVFQKARPVPYAAVQKISTEIDRLVSTQVLTSIDHSEWAAPIVAVQKKNGSIRLRRLLNRTERRT
ncbi:hypothetical protein TELCIR_03527 [Teladorsagia circumcincta]|uniref:Zinc knuckle n=1 Tax=Teladorsagia circumcincta TaxID=45464 RepID=A0A2G9UWD4_TELCI|nr:hypothetical protein TELCIR_03527 [Teladorsagia circumcincta]